VERSLTDDLNLTKGCLIGRLLPRMLLKERGVSPAEMSFSATPAGKPYVASPPSGITHFARERRRILMTILKKNTTTPKSDRPFEFNVSHDNALIVMAFASGQDDPAHHSPCQVGVDVMRVALPGRESLESFIQIVGNQVCRFLPH
jgi:4'-phosphopantetheinyl transferase